MSSIRMERLAEPIGCAHPRATLCGDRACRGREMQARVRFGPVRRILAQSAAATKESS